MGGWLERIFLHDSDSEGVCVLPCDRRSMAVTHCTLTRLQLLALLRVTSEYVLIAHSKSILSTLPPPTLDKYWDFEPGTATKLQIAALRTTPGQVEMSRPDSI